MNETTEEDYINQIKQLHKLAKAWVAEHPDADVKIQFNYPKDVMLIATAVDALEKGFVTTNPEGRKMLEDMGTLNPGPKMPSIFMVRLAIEYINEEV
jgi:hypothetical protein